MSSTAVTPRAAQLVAAVKRVTDAHARYVANPDLINPPDEFFTAAREACEQFESGDLPAVLRPLAEAMDRFADRLEEYDRLDPQPADPGNNFWVAFEALLAIMQAPARRLAPLESIADLTDQKVPDPQICQIYGFVDDYQRPRIDLLAKERRQPGSVIASPDGMDGKPWRDPREKDLEAELGTTLADLLRSPSAYSPSAYSPSVAAESPACPETIEQLFAQGVPEQQAARMLKMDIHAVAERYEALMMADDEAKKSAKRK